MSRDVIITPASGLVDFQGTSGISSASIQVDTLGNLTIANSKGDLSIGSTSLYIGDGTNNVNIVFEQDSYIRSLSGKTIDIGGAGSFVNIDTTLRLKPFNGEGGELRFDFINGAAGYYIDVDGINHLRFSNYNTTGVYKFILNSVERARLSNEGNLGINTNNPTSRLHVVGDSLITGISTLRYISSPVITGIATASRISISTADSSVAQPEITFTGAAGTTITLTVLDDQYGTLSFSGSQGQLFSINNNLSVGSIFSVNDVSGIPSIDVDADGTVSLASFNGTVGIGTTLPSRFVDINGDIRIRGALYASDNDAGANGQVLISTSNGVDWATVSSAIGGLVGVNVQDEGVGVGTTIPTINFTGSGIQALPAVGNILEINVNSTSNNTPNTIVFRDGSGNFSAGNITASLTGNVNGNATTSNTSGYASVAGISTNILGPESRIFYNSSDNITTSSNNLTYNGFTLTHSGIFNQNGTLNVYQINLPQNTNGVGFATTTANPNYYVGQAMGDNDYWKIYGESPSGTNTGTLVFEVQDDIDNSENFEFRSRRTNSSVGVITALRLDTSQAIFNGSITALSSISAQNLILTNPTNALISGPTTITIDPATVGNETGIVRIRGDLIVDGTQTQVNSTTIDFADLNVGIATTVGTNLLLDGGGIGIGSTNIRKTIQWNNVTTSLKSSENWDLAFGKVYKINGSDVLTNNTLGAGVVNSSLTSVGTLSSLTVSGQITMSGSSNIIFNDSGTTTRGIRGTSGGNDQWFFGGGATASDSGFLEISTGDNGTEPIYVRQYSGTPPSGTIQRTLTLLDAAGDTDIPGSLTIGGSFSLNTDLTVSGYFYRGNSIKTASLFVRGTGLNASANRLVYLNGTAVVNTNTRGLTLSIIDVNLTHVSSTNYDTHGSSTASDNLATAIANLNTGQIAVLTSYDSWEGQITNNLRAAALKVGLTKLANFGGSGSRRPYSAVFYGTSDDSNAAPHDVIERMESNDIDAPKATIYCNLASEGSSVAVQGATSVNALYSAESTTEDPAVYVNSNNNTTVTGILTASGGINVGSNEVINTSGNVYFSGVPTLINQNRGIYWSAYDKETTGDFTDTAHIRHTVASGGLSGSVIEISSQNDVGDGVNIIVNSSANGARINGNVIWHAGNGGSGTGLDADTVDGYQTATVNTANTIVVRDALGGFVAGVVTCTDLNSTSDIRLKTSIRQIDNSLEKVLSIRGVNFEWRENHRQSAGVIAQEVEKVLPELVEGDKTKTVNYNGLIGVLIEAIKEQQKQIEELKGKISK